jgi:lipopolysaccharide transport system permease protein
MATTRPRPTVIRAQKGWIPIDFGELWSHRELLFFLIWRDIKVRYKQTVLGVAWAIIQPVFSMVIFTVFFGRLGKIPSDGIPYPIFAYCGLLAWQFFQKALNEASVSLSANERLISKIYFPRLFMPAAVVCSGLIDFAISFFVLVVMMMFYGIMPSPTLIVLPVFILLLMVAALGVGLFLASLEVQYRDIRYTLPFLSQVWLFASPVVYPSTMVPARWRTLYGLNPMGSIIEGFRWAILGKGTVSASMLAVSTAIVLAFMAIGLVSFRRMERHFADIV